MSSKNTHIDVDTSNDFGFSFVHDGDSSNMDEIVDLKNRLKELRGMFLPLLENLNKNPGKDMIKWPNRKELLDDQIRKLKELTNI